MVFHLEANGPLEHILEPLGDSSGSFPKWLASLAIHPSVTWSDHPWTLIVKATITRLVGTRVHQPARLSLALSCPATRFSLPIIAVVPLSQILYAFVSAAPPPPELSLLKNCSRLGSSSGPPPGASAQFLRLRPRCCCTSSSHRPRGSSLSINKIKSTQTAALFVNTKCLAYFPPYLHKNNFSCWNFVFYVRKIPLKYNWDDTSN